MTGRNWIELLLLGAVWGAGFLFSRIALDTIHPFTLVFIRVLLACAVLALYLAFSGRFVLPSRQVAAQLAVLALLNNVIPFTLIFTGQTALGAGIASVVNA
ncbi:MAG: EamA family transporter, partial [Brucellaceae bacterium]|nr:EamA family transporter [Brucellaceae bacterium]